MRMTGLPARTTSRPNARARRHTVPTIVPRSPAWRPLACAVNRLYVQLRRRGPRHRSPTPRRSRHHLRGHRPPSRRRHRSSAPCPGAGHAPSPGPGPTPPRSLHRHRRAPSATAPPWSSAPPAPPPSPVRAARRPHRPTASRSPTFADKRAWPPGPNLARYAAAVGSAGPRRAGGPTRPSEPYSPHLTRPPDPCRCGC